MTDKRKREKKEIDFESKKNKKPKDNKFDPLRKNKRYYLHEYV